MKKYIDENSLNEKIGKVYKGAWIATSTSSIEDIYTESITVPAGTYIINIRTPYSSNEETNSEKILITLSAATHISTGIIYINPCYDSKTITATFDKTTTFAVRSAASMNSIMKCDLLDRGGLVAIKIS